MNQFKASAVTSLSSPVPWPVPVVGEKVFLTADVRILGANRAPAGGRSRDQAAQHRGHAVRLAAGQVLRPGEKFRRRRRAAEEGSQRQRGDRALLVRRNPRPRGWAGSKVGCPPRGRQHRPGQRYPGPGGSNPADARGFHSELPEHAAKQHHRKRASRSSLDIAHCTNRAAGRKVARLFGQPVYSRAPCEDLCPVNLITLSSVRTCHRHRRHRFKPVNIEQLKSAAPVPPRGYGR